MGLSGKLAAETNKVEGGAVLKHQPPMDAAKPDKKWRLYVFKDGKMQDEPLYIHRYEKGFGKEDRGKEAARPRTRLLQIYCCFCPFLVFLLGCVGTITFCLDVM